MALVANRSSFTALHADINPDAGGKQYPRAQHKTVAGPDINTAVNEVNVNILLNLVPEKHTQHSFRRRLYGCGSLNKHKTPGIVWGGVANTPGHPVLSCGNWNLLFMLTTSANHYEPYRKNCKHSLKKSSIIFKPTKHLKERVAMKKSVLLLALLTGALTPTPTQAHPRSSFWDDRPIYAHRATDYYRYEERPTPRYPTPYGGYTSRTPLTYREAHQIGRRRAIYHRRHQFDLKAHQRRFYR